MPRLEGSSWIDLLSVCCSGGSIPVRPLSYRIAVRVETVDTISMVGLNSVIFWNKSLVDATDGHAREYFPVGDPRIPRPTSLPVFLGTRLRHVNEQGTSGEW